MSLRGRRVQVGEAVVVAVAVGAALLLSHGSGSGDTGSGRSLSVNEVRRSEQPPPHQLLAEFATNPRLHAAYVAGRLRRVGVPGRQVHLASAGCRPIGPPLFTCRAADPGGSAPETDLYLLAYYEPSRDRSSIWFLENGSGRPNFLCDGSASGRLSRDRSQCVDLIRRDGFRSRAPARG